MANDELVRDPRDMTDEEREEFFSNIYRAPRVPAAAPLEPAPTMPVQVGETLPRVSPPTRLTKPEAPAGSTQDTLNQLEEARYRREHPMGTLGTPTGYSGVGGKVLHTLGRIGNIAGQAVVPNLMATIPGTDVYQREKEAGLQARLERQQKEASEETLRTAQAGEARSRAEQAEQEAAKLRRTAGAWQPAPGPPEEVLRTNTATGERERLFRNEAGQQQWGPETGIAPAETLPSTGARPTPQAAAPGTLAPVQPVAPPPAPPQQPKYSYGVTPKLSAEQEQRDMVAAIAAKPENQRTANEQDFYNKFATRYEKDIPITQQQADRENARIRTTFAGVPGGKPEAYFVKKGDSLYDVKQAEANAQRDITALNAAANRNMKQADKYYIYEGKLVRGNKVPLDADATPVKDPEKMRQKMTAVDSFLKQIDRYQGSFDSSAGKLTRDDLAALETLTDANVAHGFAEDLIGMVSDFVAGKPLQGYSQKVMRGVMTEEQYNRMSQPARDLLVKYYNTILNNFANIRERLNALGRNESMIQAEIHTIPLPYIDNATATSMLNDKRTDVTDNAWWLTQEEKAEAAPRRPPAPPTTPPPNQPAKGKNWNPVKGVWE